MPASRKDHPPTAPQARRPPKHKQTELPWRERPLVQIQLASQVSGLSPTSIYRMASQGRLVLKRLAGRVLVETSGLVKFIESAEPWTPSDRGTAARAKRSEIARANWTTGGALD
jgi:hypothetical protein